MSDDRIDIDLDVKPRGVKKAFKTLEKGSAKTAKKISSNFSTAISGSFTKTLANAKTQLLGIAAAFASIATGGLIIRNIKDLDRAFTEIKTIIPDITQANEELRQSLIKTSSQFGTSASEQAKSFYQIISAGITDATEANKVLIAANKLAIGGLTSTEVSVDILTSAINAFGAENLSAAKASDILFGTVRLGKTRVENLAGALGAVLPTAAALKVSFEDVSAAIAVLTTRGLSTSEAVTQVNAVFTAVLRKQELAKTLGLEVAEAFSIQSLQTKGLTKFLFDLNFALGGSERGLIKLLGRVEGARAILTLGADNFKKLGQNVQELETQTGAAERAFDKVNNTIGQQLKLFGSTVSNIFTNISESSNKSIVSFLKDAVKLAQTISQNLGAIANAVKIATKFFISFLIAVKLAPAILTATRLSFKFLSIEIGLIPTRLALARLNLQLFAVSLRTLTFRGAVIGMKRFIVGLKGTRIALAGVRLGVNLLKGALTLGLSFAIDFIIIKFIEMKDEFGGFGNLVEFTVLTIRRSFRSLILESVRLAQSMQKIPVIGEQFATSFGGELALLESESVVSLKNIDDQFDKLAQKVF